MTGWSTAAWSANEWGIEYEEKSRLDGKVVFVPGTVPGDTDEVATEEDKKPYAVARLTAVRQPSAQRRQPPCPYIPRCGGCPWQHIDYAEQLRAKQALGEEALQGMLAATGIAVISEAGCQTPGSGRRAGRRPAPAGTAGSGCP